MQKFFLQEEKKWNRFVDLLRKIKPNEFEFKVREKEWSIKEIIWHLWERQNLALEVLPILEKDQLIPEEINITRKPEGRWDVKILLPGQVIEKLTKTRERLLLLIKKIGIERIKKNKNMKEWVLHTTYIHYNLHIKQIEEILQWRRNL